MDKKSKEQCLLLKKIIKESSSIALFWHKSIDGDCIGSMLARGTILEKQWKKVSYHTPDKPDEHFAFIKKIEKIKTEFIYKKYDLIFFLDFSDYKRINKFTDGEEKYFQAQNTIIIDHHPENNEKANIIIKNTHASSNCERLLQIIKAIYPKTIDQEIATYLYLWLVTDTGNMTYENNSLETIKNAYELIKYGADKKMITDNMLRKTKMSTMRLFQLCLERLSEYDNKNIIYTYYTNEELKSYGLGTSDIDYIIYNCQNIQWYKVFCMIKMSEEKTKISLRSRDTWVGTTNKAINVSTIAQGLNGWGHYYAAWAEPKRTKKKDSEEIEYILNKINIAIQKQELEYQ